VLAHTLLPMVAVAAGLATSGVLVVSSTEAAFTARSSNGGNSWTTGVVTLADDDSGQALFTVTNLLPGDTGSKCIRVTYSGTVTASVKLFATSVTGTLAPDLRIVVTQGAGGGNVGAFGTCAGGFSGTTIYDGALSAFPTTWAGGLGSFAPTGAGQFTVYRFDYELPSGTPSDRQGRPAAVDFRWESRS
jgi:hypothetical protein